MEKNTYICFTEEEAEHKEICSLAEDSQAVQSEASGLRKTDDSVSQDIFY